jgi:hypothetical protein
MGQQTLFASAARTATPTAAEFLKGRAERLVVVINVTAVTSTPAVTPRIDFWDDASGTWTTMLSGAALATVSKVVLRVGPGMPVVANVSANDGLPDRLRVDMGHGNANSITYSVGAHLLD